MDLFLLSLQIHLVGAVSLGLLLLVTVGSLYRASTSAKLYKSLAISLAAVTAIEVVTGSALYVLAADPSLVSFCSKMAIYLSLTAVAEYALVNKLRSLAPIEV